MDTGEIDWIVETTHRHSVRLQRLTNDILDVTRIESEALILDMEKFKRSCRRRAAADR